MDKVERAGQAGTDCLHARGPFPKRIIVEGWRFLAHSYAIVNQWQLLALLRRADVTLKVVDVPFFSRRWRTQDGLFEPEAEQALLSLDAAGTDEAADVTLRLSFPFDFSLSKSRITAVFGTSESQSIRKDQVRGIDAFERLRRRMPATLKAVTPSRWSAEGFYKAGFKAEQVLVVPHGVDPGTYRPIAGVRNLVRSKMGIAEDQWVFLFVGGMGANKGIDLVLKAFARVSRKCPEARLLLKGMDQLYKSKSLLEKALDGLPAPDRQRVTEKMIYFGRSFSNANMAKFYQAADVYVSPYRAEGFNMPVLEAAACGLPVICTRGGSTDDFVIDAFAKRVASQKVSMRHKDEEVCWLEPDLEDLTAHMIAAVQDHGWRTQARNAGPLHVHANYTWDRVVDMLVRKLFN